MIEHDVAVVTDFKSIKEMMEIGRGATDAVKGYKQSIQRKAQDDEKLRRMLEEN
ncbi:hypothetical protein [Pseudogracilibacillus sp. SO30301A]|uniref:hypothetical protein n=1 Tax=Pseudogracilibacillus sp. SO30301A TaxID=3098291 RepID=UPI00300E3CD2